MTVRHGWVTILLGAAVWLTGCSSGGSAADPATGSAAAGASSGPSSATASSADPPAGSSAAPAASKKPIVRPADPCSMITEKQVAQAAIGFTGLVPRTAPPSGCMFQDAGGKVIFLYRLSTKEELPGGAESLANGAMSAMNGQMNRIAIRDFEGFMVSGTGTGVQETQVALTVQDYTLECSTPQRGGDAADQRALCGEVIAAIIDNLP